MLQKITDFTKRFIANQPSRKFWLWQVGFWLFVSVMSFAVLTLWYGPFSWPHILHIILQALLGLMLSLVLYWVFMHIWDKSTRFRALVGFITVMLVSFVWTMARVYAFISLTGDGTEWTQFGGWHFASIFIFLCWAGLFHGIRYYELLQTEHIILLQAESEAKEEQLKRMKAQNVARDAQLKMLRYQLNPHFLCNTLNAINSLVESNETVKAQKMTVQLSKFLRYSLDNNPDTKIPLETEVNALNLYLEIEKTRFEDRLRLDFEITAEAKSALLPSLLLQPIIENSMKHAIAQSESGGTIEFRADVVDHRLILQLSDTGSGAKIAKSKLKSSTGRGVGLRNTDERLKALYSDDYSMDIKLLPSGGLKTIINIPCEYNLADKVDRTNTKEKTA
ncbi:histidine kinase [Aliiglaciecola sp. 2_MG-2023]|uniref:sensor histidine kinase n=1 Tax=unclassified Aliiglaciecola TaxID=2593648 RepID=UPI0026E11849|nr:MULTISPECIES: histidine kinase [unclassified Aliiglaciecola]MDO6709801.1 histidine kinase [Aliiglaciecola sp. 2_MG-2023]MDO6750657.1 histidine kinase [Aliiglaciecola sp. 1_MG-2023]